MKKSVKLLLQGSVSSLFFEQFIKNNADSLDVRGFMRKLENGKVEIFLEGDNEKVDEMTEICKIGPQYAQIRNVEVKEERFQDFKDFRVLKI